MATPADLQNESFFNRTQSPEGRTKIAELGGSYIRDRLRESAFSRRVVPTQNVTRAELQRSTNHDTLVKIVDIEPNSAAMAITFRGQPTARFIRADRYEIPFFTISSEKFEKTEQELLAYEMPITKIIEENTVKDLQTIEDRQFTIYTEACVQAYQLFANGGVATKLNATTVNAGSVVLSSVLKSEGALTSGTNDFVVHPILKPDLINLKKLLHRRHLRAERLLITEPDYDNISAWTIQDVGMTIAGETATTGWMNEKVCGLKIIRTIKLEVLSEGVMYVFTAPEFFGRFYILNQTKFYIDKIANLITWQSWEDIGMGFGNVSAVVKLEAFSGSCVPGQTDTGFAAALPASEDQSFPVNNLVGPNGANGAAPSVQNF